MNVDNHKLWRTYNSWYTGNRQSLLSNKWKLVPQNILKNPLDDKLRGLNLIAFLDSETNEEINRSVVEKIKPIIANQWFIPGKARHVTILDILPHNSGVSEDQIVSEKDVYAEVVNGVVEEFSNRIRVSFSGIFASPDGITLQGFPINNGLSEFRQKLRTRFANKKQNQEENKYVINTAHVSLVKFVKPLDGQALVELVDSLRKTKLISFEIRSLVLNISSRYDKIETIDVIRKWKI